MSGEPEKQEQHPLQHEAEHERPPKKLSVMTYLTILFAVAFVLLLMSYFMQQRSNEEALNHLKDTSISAVQSLDDLIQDNSDLKQQVTDLELEKAALEQKLSGIESTQITMTQTNEIQAKQLEAMDWFWRIQREYSRGRARSAQELAEAFESTGLVPSLPTQHPADADGPSPAEQYQALKDAIY